MSQDRRCDVYRTRYQIQDRCYRDLGHGGMCQFSDAEEDIVSMKELPREKLQRDRLIARMAGNIAAGIMPRHGIVLRPPPDEHSAATEVVCLGASHIAELSVEVAKAILAEIEKE